MLVKTSVKFMGCCIWLEGNNARTAKHAAIRLNKWFLNQIGESLWLKDTDDDSAADTTSKVKTK